MHPEIANDRIRGEDGNPLTPSEIEEIMKAYEDMEKGKEKKK